MFTMISFGLIAMTLASKKASAVGLAKFGLEVIQIFLSFYIHF